MLTRSIITALALSLGLAAPVAVSAADAPAKSVATKSVEAQLKDLKKAVGAGEISAKEYKVRKEALLAGSSQTAKTEPK
jgi:predicted secreted protein